MKNYYDIEFLKETFELQEDATLVWATRPRHHFPKEHGMNIFNANRAGKQVGFSKGGHGHLTIPVTVLGQKKRLQVSRVVYTLFHNQNIPDGHVVDHVDGDPENNHPSNLRVTTRTLNNRNAVHTPGSSGCLGVRQTKSGRYTAVIGSHKSRVGFYHLGTFDTLKEAYAARIGAGVVLDYTTRHLKEPHKQLEMSDVDLIYEHEKRASRPL